MDTNETLGFGTDLQMRDAKLNGDCCIEVLELLGAHVDRQRPYGHLADFCRSCLATTGQKRTLLVAVNGAYDNMGSHATGNKIGYHQLLPFIGFRHGGPIWYCFCDQLDS
ncbi:hypothetical protein [Pseudomonas sp. CFBP 13715]|uniref:hypothetical protein n=1 Tax=Pseudomonas sp. CFBP 13715 TaxID=2775306 RepID=UPI00178170E1|nr:hypothetical protein [Pseudomonas sp. CFBP 13715]MBD8714802.1 hypothetical protein [Pseudomonas sp. CFBP 13715]